MLAVRKDESAEVDDQFIGHELRIRKRLAVRRTGVRGERRARAIRYTRVLASTLTPCQQTMPVLVPVNRAG